MMDATSMSPPATRGEPTAEREPYGQRIDRKLDEWGAALLADLDASEQRLLVGFERIFKEALERSATQLAAIKARPADRLIDPDPEQRR